MSCKDVTLDLRKTNYVKGEIVVLSDRFLKIWFYKNVKLWLSLQHVVHIQQVPHSSLVEELTPPLKQQII